MPKFIKILILPVVAIIMLGGFASVSFAIEVQFENTPLFSEVNFVPGDSVSRFVILNNNNASPRSVILKAINIVNDGNLGDSIGLIIKQDDTVLFDNSFSNLFSQSEQSEILLSQVPAHGEAVFDFIATFKPEAGNNYQGSKMGFNLQIGFDGGDVADDANSFTVAVGGEFNTAGGNNGGGGGQTIIGHKNLIISDESVQSDESLNTVVIKWNTNIPSTSQVIYGLTSAGPYNLDLTKLFLGYPFATVEQDLDPNKILNHSVTISDLLPGEYNYRVVSRASPPTISSERTFTIGENGKLVSDKNTPTDNFGSSSQTAGQNNSSPDLTVVSQSVSQEINNGSEANNAPNSAASNISNENNDLNNNNNLLANVFSAFTNLPSQFYWITLILLIALIVFAVRKTK